MARELPCAIIAARLLREGHDEMMRMARRAIALIATAVVLCASCAAAFDLSDQRIDRPDHDIVILHTNDVHCGVDDNIGYAGLAAFRSAMLEQTPYVAVVDCGDMIQGSAIGAISSGDAIVEMMNAVGYDAITLGNHEFDYGVPRLAELLRRIDADVVGVNVRYLGEGRSPLPKLKRYKMMTFGPTKVAFIGVSTPETMTAALPTYFMHDGKYVWSFGGEDVKAFYANIQMTIDECRISGADYVILMTHVGDGESYGPFASPEIAKHTRGVDAIIDGHQHSVIPSRYERSLTGSLVPITSTGTKLANIGRVVITSDGHVASGLISEWHERDPEVARVVDEVKGRYTAVLDRPVAEASIALPEGTGGVRMLRVRETPLANFVADACREVLGAQIGLVNGGSVRAPLAAGTVRLRDLLSIHPFGVDVVAVKATGQQVLDSLEWGARFVEAQASDGSEAIGEFGGFMHASGLRYTIDTSVKSTVEFDHTGSFYRVAGARRVKDVQVADGDGWRPIDPDAVYTVAGGSFLILGGGDGNVVFKECELVPGAAMPDLDVLERYLRDVLRGDLSRYAAPEGRITVK